MILFGSADLAVPCFNYCSFAVSIACAYQLLSTYVSVMIGQPIF